MRRKILILLTVFSFVFLLLAQPAKVQASGSVSGADMIALINGWRASYWTNSLIEVSTLDACAQWTAEEMASIGAKDHLKYLGYSETSTRCSEFGFGGGKLVYVTENWAAGYNMDIDTLAGYWSDEAHMLPATMQQYTYVGVGIATASDGMTYYILQAGAVTGEDMPAASDNTSDTSGNASATEDLSNYMNPVFTSTPNSDGSIYHVVQYGQTLFDIATNYGVGYDAIKNLNGLTDNTIYEGQSLLIKLAPTPTITPTRTSTAPMPTRTLMMATSTTTPQPSATATPTPEGSIGSRLPVIDRQWIGLGLLVISAVGFFVVFYFFFLKKSKPKE